MPHLQGTTDIQARLVNSSLTHQCRPRLVEALDHTSTAAHVVDHAPGNTMSMRWPITANALSPYLCAMGENRARRLNSSTSTTYPRGMEASVLAETRKKSLCSKKGIRLFSRKKTQFSTKTKKQARTQRIPHQPSIVVSATQTDAVSLAPSFALRIVASMPWATACAAVTPDQSPRQSERGVADLEGTCSRCFWWKCFFNSRSSSSSFVAILKTANSTGPAWESWVATTTSMQDPLQCGSA